MSDPWSGGETAATIKAGKGYDEPWLVFRGPNAASVKKQVEEATGLSGEGISLMELTWNANYSFQKISTVATGLDAVIIEDDEGPQNAAGAAENASAAPEATEPENVAPAAPEPSLTDQVNALTVKKDLTALYLANKKAFDGDKDLMSALQARFTAEDVT